MNNKDTIRTESVYQKVKLIKPFKKSNKNENNEKNSPVHTMYTHNVRLTKIPKNNTTPIAPPSYIRINDFNELIRAFDSFQNNLITNSKSK
jgi:hypothetical protein